MPHAQEIGVSPGVAAHRVDHAGRVQLAQVVGLLQLASAVHHAIAQLGQQSDPHIAHITASDQNIDSGQCDAVFFKRPHSQYGSVAGVVNGHGLA